jgi:hypothetical protein
MSTRDEEVDTRRRGVVADPYRHGGDPEWGARRKPSAVVHVRGESSTVTLSVSEHERARRKLRMLEYEQLRREVRAEMDAADWTDPPPGLSLSSAREHPPQEPQQVVADILPPGLTILAAQFKAGKTTLAINLADSLGSGEDFLGTYPVDFPEGSVVYWNMEVDEPLFFAWQNAVVKDEDSARRFITYHLRGKQVNLLYEPHAEWAVRSLCEAQAQAWIIDPLGRMLENENDNSEFNRWLRAVERIRRLADLRLVFIPHHTGHVVPGREEAIPRGRGSSAQLGGTDCNLSYRHGGPLGGYPPNTRRYLSGFGRGVELAEITLDYDPGTSRLAALNGAPGRSADREARLAELAVDALTLADAERLNSTALQDAIGGSGKDRPAAIKAAVRRGLIVQKREGRNMWYSLPPADPKKRMGSE